LDPTVQADPYLHYAELRRTAPVHFVPSLDAYAVSRYADVRTVLHDNDTYSNEAMAALVARPADYADHDRVEPFTSSIIGMDGEEHARLRRIVNRGFTPKRISQLESEVRVIARNHLDALADRGTGDLQAGFAVPIPTVVIAMLLGVDPDLREEFRRWSEHMVLAVFEPDAAERGEDIGRSGEQMGDWLDSVIVLRDGRDGDDLISVLLRAELDGGALTHDELRVFVFTLLVAGSITTAYLIGNAVHTLVTMPEIQALVRREPTLVPSLVDESLRHDTPTQMMFRTVTRSTDIAGATLAPGATVLALIASANRDPAVFTDPDAFVVGRENHDSLAFGHGAHFCLGAALAKLEARVALEEILARSSALELAGDPEWVNSLVFHGPTRLPIRVV
jgi:cytochrome P450